MTIGVQVKVNRPAAAVWEVIIDIGNAAENIGGIERVEIFEEPDEGIVGLKWRETRTLFGKTASEEMWITEAVENEYYKTRAESHGCVYTTTMSLSGSDGGSSLNMSHQTEPQTLISKLMSPMGFLFKGAIRKMILQDLNDIKAAAESREG